MSGLDGFAVHRNAHGVLQFEHGPRTLIEAWNSTRVFGPRPALTYGDDTWTYDELHDDVDRTATWLACTVGVRAGDRVAIAMRNYPEWVVAFLAAQRLGAAVVPLNAWASAAEMQHLLAVATPAVVIADEERLDRLEESGWRGLRVAVRADRPADFRWADRRTVTEDAVVPATYVRPDHVATVLFTSGTTGLPKPVAHTHLNHVTTLMTMRLRAADAARGAGLRPDVRGVVPGRESTVLLVFPLFHVAGLTLLTSSLYAGSHVVSMYKWDAAAAAAVIGRLGVTDVSGPPMVVQQLVGLAASAQHDLETLRSIGIGGSAASPSEIAALDAAFEGRVAPGTGYGMTETTSAVTSLAGDALRAAPGFVGRPVGTAEIRIVDEQGTELPRGESGEIEIRGSQIAVSGSAALAPSLAPVSGWLATGDVGRLDEHGSLEIVGRLKDVIIRGGENVYAVEVENVLEAHPRVAEAAVVGRPHASLGEEVVAIVRVRPGVELLPGELQEHAARGLAAFKVPVEWVVVEDPLPRSATGKLVKDECRALVQLGTQR